MSIFENVNFRGPTTPASQTLSMSLSCLVNVCAFYQLVKEVMFHEPHPETGLDRPLARQDRHFCLALEI